MKTPINRFKRGKKRTLQKGILGGWQGGNQPNELKERLTRIPEFLYVR